MALAFYVLWAGRRQPAEWERLAADYRKRIAAFHPVSEQPVKVKAAADDPARLRREAEALIAAAPADALWIGLDRQGDRLDSEQLATLVEEWRRTWSRPVAFFIGSDLGLDTDLLARCRRRISFGPLTLAHALARLVLLEQLYRALTLGAGWPYHRG